MKESAEPFNAFIPDTGFGYHTSGGGRATGTQAGQRHLWHNRRLHPYRQGGRRQRDYHGGRHQEPGMRAPPTAPHQPNGIGGTGRLKGEPEANDAVAHTEADTQEAGAVTFGGNQADIQAGTHHDGDRLQQAARA